jgi:hypothetical protein
MTTDTFPYWGFGSVQRPNNIPGRGVRTHIEDLIVNQAPRPRSDEVQLIARPLPRVRSPEYPAYPGPRNRGKYGGSLYDLFLMTEEMPREEVVRLAGNAEVRG